MVEYVSKEAADDFEPKYSEVAPKSIRFLHRAAKTFLSRPFTYTVEPDSAIPLGIAHPIPRVEPVTKAACPSSQNLETSLFNLFILL